MEESSLRDFVRSHTEPMPVPLVPSIRLFTATEVAALWSATEAWLVARGVAIPFWSVPWAGGQALARWVLDHPEVVRGKRVLDFGAGSGLVAIAAAQAGAASVRAVDIDPLSLAACALNAEANDVTFERVCADIVGDAVQADVLLAGDVWYEEAPAARFAEWFGALAANGTRILTGDPGRHYVPRTMHVLATYEVPTPWELESATSRSTRVLEMPAAPTTKECI